LLPRQPRLTLFPYTTLFRSYGQSRGGSAMVEIARELGKHGTAVLLTVQVDGVKCFGADDGVIPPNVARAANFYQPDRMEESRHQDRKSTRLNSSHLGISYAV